MVKIKKRKVYARSQHNIWVTDLTEMGLLSYKNWGIRYLLCVVDVFTKYAWVKPLKDKKAKIILNGFIQVVNADQTNYGLIKE